MFLGGAINAVVIENFLGWYNWAMPRFDVIQLVAPFLFYGILAFFTPLFVSWFFSRLHPEKRIVPPFYIQAVSFGLLVLLNYSVLLKDQSLFWVAMYAYSAGMTQDEIMIYSLGKNALPDDIIKYSFEVDVDIARVQEIVMSKQFRGLLGLKRIIKKAGESLKLRSARKTELQVILELKETGKKNRAIINLAVYVERKYAIKHIEKTDDVYEYATEKILYIKDYFKRRHSIYIDDAPLDNVESLVNYILDDLQGTMTRFQETTRRKQLSIIVAIASFIVSLGLFAFGEIDKGLAALGIAIVIFVDVVRD